MPAFIGCDARLFINEIELKGNWEFVCPYNFIDEFDKWLEWQKQVHVEGKYPLIDLT